MGALQQVLMAGSAPPSPVAWNTGTGSGHWTFSSANRVATFDDSATYYPIASTSGKSSGKWYAEILIGGSVLSALGVGFSIAGYNASAYLGSDANGWAIYVGGAIFHSATAHIPAGGVLYAVGDIVNLAADIDTGKLWWGQNNTWVLSGNPSTGANPVYTEGAGLTLYLGASSSTGTATSVTIQPTQTYTPPTGFSQWTA